MSPEMEERWLQWRHYLVNLNELQLPRCYFPVSVVDMFKLELHVFFLMHRRRLCVIADILGYTEKGDKHVGFVIGKSNSK